MKNTDWVPAKRQDLLTMAQNWEVILQKNSWGIPADTVAKLTEQIHTAEAALSTVDFIETRTAVTVSQCKTAFSDLVTCMRDIKKRWFHMSPLDTADLVSLNLTPPKTVRSKKKAPTGEATVVTFLSRRQQLGIKIIHGKNDSDASVYKGYRIWYAVVGHGETPPSYPEELHTLFYTKKKRDVIDFDCSDSGKTAWFTVQIDNDGKVGSRGPLSSALIP
jgi:hypothetical protein